MGNEVAKYYRNLDDATLKAFWKAGGVINGVEYPLADTFLHTHTDMGSPKDSVLTIEEYVSIADKMGARSISITDHGTMYGVIPLYKACDAHNAKCEEDEKIKCIIGIEFYVCDQFITDVKHKQTRLHLIAYAKDDIGYHTLCRLTTEANKHITKVGSNAYPCISKAELEKFLAPGTEGHGHVILTSACIGGVVAGMMFESDNEKINAQKYENGLKALAQLQDSIDFQSKKLQELEEIKANLSSLTKKTYKKRISQLEKYPDPEAQKALEAEMKESEEAKKQLPQCNNMIKGIKATVSEINKQIDAQCKNVSADTREEKLIIQARNLTNALEAAKANIISEAEVEERFTEAMKYYENLAGKGNWFIEMQYHGVPAEKKYMHILASLANKLDMPLVAANDAHMPTRELTEARKIVNALRFDATWEAPTEDEYELYLKTDAELFKWLCMEISEDDAFKAMKNRQLITDACNVTLKKEKHYPKFVA